MISKLLSNHTDGRESYQSIYNQFFPDSFCVRVKNILEIGVQFGVGLRAWAKTFPTATIYGCEQSSQPIPKDLLQNSRVRIFTDTDSAIPEHAKGFFDAIANAKMDVIIDDGDHQESGQLSTLRNFWPHLSPDGIYVMEDTGQRNLTEPFVTEIQRICKDGIVSVGHAGVRHAGVVIITPRRPS